MASASGAASLSGGGVSMLLSACAPSLEEGDLSCCEMLSGDALEVKGCVAGGLICRGQTWTRIK